MAALRVLAQVIIIVGRVRRLVGLCIVCVMVGFGINRVVLVVAVGLCTSMSFVGFLVAVGIVNILDGVLENWAD